MPKEIAQHLVIATLLVTSCAALACQSYTSGLQKSETRVDETVAIGALRAISVAQRTYSVSNGGSYGSFEQLVQGGYLDSRFSGDKPKMKGYVLSLTVTTKSVGSEETSYTVKADPEAPQPGRHFYLDSASGLIHINASQPAGVSDPTLDQ